MIYIFLMAIVIAVHGLKSEDFINIEVSLLTASLLLFTVAYGL